jgi:origin recognition complex subunit 2
MATDDDEEIDEVDESDESSSDDDESNLRPTDKGKAEGRNGLIVQTAFDAYFAHNKSGRIQTSSSVFSELIPPLSAQEYVKAIGASGKGQTVQASVLRDTNREQLFARFMCELGEGFNILCYGLGSKRQILNQFATDCCSNRGHVVVVNGFQPESTLKDVLDSIENIPDIQDHLGLSAATTTVEKRTKRVYDFFASSAEVVELYIVIHNIDAPPFRAAKTRSVLSLLAHNARIHLIASIDHINAPLLWSSSEAFSRKPHDTTQADVNAADDNIPSHGFAWLWHDLTTLAPYDFELAFADRTSLSGAHYGGPRRRRDLANPNAIAMDPTAASHILASVTQKAQKLFALLGSKQLEAAADGVDGVAQQIGLAYDVLFSAARDNFIATSDTALRSLLIEFRDHNLIVSSQQGMGGGEVLWIPMRKERLASVLQTLQLPSNA